MSQQQSTADAQAETAVSSATEDLTEVASRVLQHGNGIARRVLSDPDLEGNPLEFLKQTEAFWKAMKQQKHEPHKKGPTVITTSSSTISSILANSNNSSSSSSDHTPRPPSFGAAPHNTPPPAAAAAAAAEGAHANAQSVSPDFDVVMCGGTLGICVALALQQQGYRVAVVEKRRVEGRLQEWNSSRHEVQVLVDLGLLTQAQLEAAIVSEFNPIRVGFKGGAKPLTINNVLNIGVCPKTLIATMRAKFEVLGGVIYEHTAFKSGVVGSDGVVVSLMNAAGAPADVGDTNRPNAMQQQEQQSAQPLHSPFGRVAGAAAGGPVSSFAHHSSGNGSRHSSSSSNGGGGSGSSRYERWVTAAAGNGSNGSNTAADSGSNGLLTSHSAHALEPGNQHASSRNGNGRGGQAVQQQTPRQVPAAAAAAQEGSRKAPSKLTCRLLLDCMGHYSPIVKQMRGKAKPDGMVLVVGGCATGFAPESNTSADLLYSITDATADMQLFWEAFPAEGGASRTTYMFAYSDADARRPTFENLLDTYFTLMPAYQGLPSLDAVKYKRVLFGGFPCYSSTTPLGPAFDRVLQLGDASASQSPLSFGGFGSMLRHLSRLSGAIGHALRDDKLSRQDLSWIHPYQPSLSAAWLFQRSMSLKLGQQQQQQQQRDGVDNQQHQQKQQILPGAREHFADAAAVGAAGTAAAVAAGQKAAAAAATAAMSAVAAGAVASPTTHTTTTSSRSSSSSDAPASAAAAAAAGKPSWLQQLLLLPSTHINALLGANFTVMAFLGQRVLKPFLQDTLRLGPLAATMLGMMLVKPLVISRVFVQVGPKVLLGWFGHFAMLALYTLAYNVLKPVQHLSSSISRSYTFQRLLDALKYGSSSDYSYSSTPPVSSNSSSSAGVTSDTSSSSRSALPQQAPQHVGVEVGKGKVGVEKGGAVRKRQVGVANNIVPALPASWGQHEVVQHSQQQQQQPSAA